MGAKHRKTEEGCFVFQCHRWIERQACKVTFSVSVTLWLRLEDPELMVPVSVNE